MDGKQKVIFPVGRQPARIDRFLAESLPGISRSQIKQLIIDGAVVCNDRKVKPGYRAAPGDAVCITLPEPAESEICAERIPLDILYQDSDIAVINKPAGMIVHPAGKAVSGTLVNALLYRLDDLSGINGVLRPGIVHRLDKDTSGVMVVAKNDRSHRHIAAQFEARLVSKRYAALVWGTFPSGSGVIEKAIARSRSNRSKMVSGAKGRESVTRYAVRNEYGFLTLIEAHPKTGRTHQIRSHLASIGRPVFGDALYRGRNRRLAGLTAGERVLASRLLKLLPRQALHAEYISFTHPATQEPVDFSAPLPGDFKTVLDILEKQD